MAGTEAYNLSQVVFIFAGRRYRMGELTLTPPPANEATAAANGTLIISKSQQTHYEWSVMMPQSSADYAALYQQYIDYNSNEDSTPNDAANEFSLRDESTGRQLEGLAYFSTAEEETYATAAGDRTITGTVQPTANTAGAGQG